jgi:hypothetical protein
VEYVSSSSAGLHQRDDHEVVQRRDTQYRSQIRIDEASFISNSSCNLLLISIIHRIAISYEMEKRKQGQRYAPAVYTQHAPAVMYLENVLNTDSSV